jgi:thiol:disulfide interchange protein
MLAATGLTAAPQYARMGADIYDIRADGSRQIDDALAKARASHRKVLLDFGANWCIWCRRLHHTFQTDAAVRAKLADSYLIVMIDVNTRDGAWRNTEVDRRYGNPTRLGIPVLVVLDENGRILATKDTGELEEGNHHSPAKILAFLGK